MKSPTFAAFLLIALVVLTSAPAFALASDFLDRALGPFRDLDFSTFYDQYAGLIDMAIYLALFVGLALATIGKRLQGRGGKAVVIAIGIAMALGLAATERSLGFNLKSLGPLAGLVIIVLLGVALLEGLKHTRIGIFGGGSLAFVISYSILRAVAPGVFAWVEEKAPIVDFLVLVAICIAVWKIVAAARTGVPGLAAQAGQAVKEPQRFISELFPTEQALVREKNEVGKKLEPVTQKAIKDAEEITEDLKTVDAVMEEHGAQPHLRYTVAQKLGQVTPKQHAMEQALAGLRRLSKRVERFDVGLFSKLKSRYAKLSPERQAVVREAIGEQVRKIAAEQRIREFEARVQQYSADFESCLTRAIQHFTSGHVHEARKWVNRSIKLEEESSDLLKAMLALERKMVALTQIEMGKLRRARRRAS